MASLELTIVAADFRPVARGAGRLSAELRPGIYQIVARAGPVIDRRLISLAPGTQYRDHGVAVAFPTAAPIRDTSTWRESHERAAQDASVRLEGDLAADAGLVIVLRDARGVEGPPLTAADVGALSLRDARLTRIAGSADGWSVDGTEAIATWSSRLPAGGYALRVQPPAESDGPRRPSTTIAYDQSVWLSAGWTTMVFLMTGPNGIQGASASVHMTRLGMEWDPRETWLGLALELAHWGLREGRSVLPQDLTGMLLGSKFQNPMLGILGAHSLLLQRPVDQRLLDTVLGNLDDLVPGHPDVRALHALAAEARDRSGAGPDSLPRVAPDVEASPAVSWPPMLFASYRALIQSDARRPGTIEDGSLAEDAASNVLVQGIWTSWTPLEERRPAVPVAGPPAVWVLPTVAADPQRLAGGQFDDPATARVADYLVALALLEGPARSPERFATLSPAEIGVATSLPARSVDRALAGIGASLVPPLPPRPDDPGEGRGGGDQAGAGGAASLASRLSLMLAAGAIVAAGLGGFALGSWTDGGDGTATPSAPLGTPPAATDAPAATSTIPGPPPTGGPQPLPVVGAPRQLLFGETLVAAESRQDLRIRNRGGGLLTILSLSTAGTNATDFRVAPGDCLDRPMARREACVTEAVFAPTAAGERVGELVIVTEEIGPHRVMLRATAVDQPTVPPELRVHPPAIDFGRVEAFVEESEARPLALTATGPIALSDWTFGGDAASDYSLDAADCGGLELRPSVACAALVTFTPSDVGPRPAELRLIASDGATTIVSLAGEGFGGVD